MIMMENQFDMQEDTRSLLFHSSKFNSNPILLSSSQRRKFFSDIKKREVVLFQPNIEYGFEIFNPYVDLNTFTLKIPYLPAIDINKYLCGQPVITIIFFFPSLSHY